MKAEWSNKDGLEMPTTSDYKEIIVKEYHNEKGLITRREIGKELVRCKDCKYAIWPNGVPLGAKGWAYSCDRKDALLGPLDDTDYCSYGERKDDECIQMGI